MKVTHAHMHQVPFVPLLGKTLTGTFSQESMPGADMSWTNDGLLVKYKGKRFLIPTANVACVVFAEDSESGKRPAPLSKAG